jgi:hypothetical protein
MFFERVGPLRGDSSPSLGTAVGPLPCPIEASTAAICYARFTALEAKLAEQQKDALGERGLFEEKLAKLKEQFEAESAAHAFAEGALQSARQERGARRQEAEAGSNAKDAPSAQVEPLRDGILRPDNDNRGTTPLELVLAWGFVGSPLLWGIIQPAHSHAQPRAHTTGQPQ